jgi:polyferredoxin
MHMDRQVMWDVLAVRPVRALARQPLFPAALQALGVAAALFLIVNGWGIGLEHSDKEVMTLRKTNLTTLLVWGLWWPAMIATALVAGRAWCTVCPMELLNRVGFWLGRHAGLSRAGLGRWLRLGWMTVVAYLVLQVLVAGLSVHRVPHYTALMLVALGVLALAAGLVFKEERSFCKTLCPAKALLGTYGRFTPLQLDVRDPGTCRGCESRDCVDAARRDRFDGRSCPSLAQPHARRPGDECVLCFQCAKSCPHENVGFGLVRDTAGSRRHQLLAPYQAVFVMFAAGFVAHEVFGEVKALDEHFHYVARKLHALAPEAHFGWFEALWFLVLMPAVLWLLTACLARLLGHRGSLRERLIAAATGAAPIVAIAHLAKAAAKVSSWGGFLPLALNDPAGANTLQGIADKSVATPAPLAGLSPLGWLMLILLVLVAWRSRNWTKTATSEHLAAARAGLLVCLLFYGSVLLAWSCC